MTETEPTSDLAYDLAHEDGREAVRPDAPAAPPSGSPPVLRTDDAGGDLGYDDAHDF